MSVFHSRRGSRDKKATNPQLPQPIQHHPLLRSVNMLKRSFVSAIVEAPPHVKVPSTFKRPRLQSSLTSAQIITAILSQPMSQDDDEKAQKACSAIRKVVKKVEKDALKEGTTSKDWTRALIDLIDILWAGYGLIRETEDTRASELRLEPQLRFAEKTLVKYDEDEDRCVIADAMEAIIRRWSSNAETTYTEIGILPLQREGKQTTILLEDVEVLVEVSGNEGYFARGKRIAELLGAERWDDDGDSSEEDD